MVAVSCIIPTHNRSAVAYAHLLALPRQTASDFEVIVVCDTCTDGTGDLLLDLVPDLPYTCRVVTTPADRRGSAAARNVGAEHAAGDVLIFHDDDCIPHPACVQHHAATCRPGVATMGYVSAVNHRRQTAETDQADKPFLFITQNVAIWRDDFVRVGGFDENLRGWGLEDHECAWRLHRAGVELRYVPLAATLELWPRPGYYTGSTERPADRRQSWNQNAAYLVAKHGDAWPIKPAV